MNVTRPVSNIQSKLLEYFDNFEKITQLSTVSCGGEVVKINALIICV